MSEPKNGRGALATAASRPSSPRPAASALFLVALGFSGAWIGNLTVLEPPIFIGAALIALFFAWRSIFRPARACKPGDVRRAQVRTTYKIMFWIVSALVLVVLAFPYVLPLFY
jgi:mercuric ion transport protein